MEDFNPPPSDPEEDKKVEIYLPPEKIETIEELATAVMIPGMTEQVRLALMKEWTIAQEKKVKTSRDTIVLNVDRATLYVLVGDIDEALNCLDEALYQAEQEKEEQLASEIFAKIQELQK